VGTAEIGLAFQADKPPGRYGELAAAAEACGFDVVSVFADLPDQPPLPALLEMARVTSRVRLGAACLNPYTPSTRLLLGAWGPRGAALGGEIADVVKVGGSASPAVVPVIRDRIRAGALAAGRSPAAVRLVLGAVTVVDRDRAVAGAGGRSGRIDFGAPHGLSDAEGVALLGTAVPPRLR
jgi:alkanesulfonate monooxygenase SsuD/methylene tetrahydromethanopterin reductase-like flavin-dependent oxidoreductase (luciferase family)